MPAVLRILDANANRAREALRVMEEAARFLLDDSELTAQIKHVRHDLAQAVALVDGLEGWRDTPGDVGTEITTRGEMQRSGVADVATAAGKRLSEALRVMEEYGKTLGEKANGFAAAIEQLRYRGYDVEQRLQRAMAGMGGRQWRLAVLVSEALCPGGDWLAVATAAAEAGADCIQLREKSLEAGELLVRAKALVKVCRGRGVSVIVNDRPDVAMAAEADGVHVGQGDLPCAEVRKLVGRQLIVGVSTSTLAEAEQALRDGADYCGVGPMFPTTTKKKEVIVGAAYLREYVQWNKLPHVAIGGVTAGNVGQLVGAGAKGVAVSSAVCAAADPAQAVREILRAMDEATSAMAR
jgi:thiamine-phosphate pyrophosphorylase